MHLTYVLGEWNLLFYNVESHLTLNVVSPSFNSFTLNRVKFSAEISQNLE